MRYQKISYEQLNARQQENHNFHKVAAVLADYGYHSIKLSDDYHGADFLAIHIDGVSILRVQLKGRLTFAKKYMNKDLYVCFRRGDEWYLYPHDELFNQIATSSNIANTSSWISGGLYSFPTHSASISAMLEPYKIVW